MSANPKPIDTAKFSEHLRSRAIDISGRKVLVSRLSGSAQEVDISEPINCEGYGRIRHFRLATSPGWPRNPLPIAPAAKALGISPVPEMMRAQVFQNSACAWRCWYCFVPENLLSADVKQSEWFSAQELVSLFKEEIDRPPVLDLSGGSPDLVPEWTVWMMTALREQNLDDACFLWGDDNLSTTYLFDKLSSSDHKLLRGYRNYGRVCCFKGFDARSFAFNTRAAESDFDRQFEIMRRMLGLGLDLYGYVTLTSPHTDGVRAGVANLVDRLQELDPNLPLRVVPLEIRIFTPVNPRIAAHQERQRSLQVQMEAIACWNDEIRRRYEPALQSLDISSVPLANGRAI